MSRMGTRFLDMPTFEARSWSEVKKGYTHFADGDVLLARITPCFEMVKREFHAAFQMGLAPVAPSMLCYARSQAPLYPNSFSHF